MSLINAEPVALRYPSGIRYVEGYRFQEFVVHRSAAGGFRISHVPTGMAVATGIAKLKKAIECMQEIARLRNDWAVLSTPEDFAPARPGVMEILARYKIDMPFNRTVDPRNLRPQLNRYRGE